MAILLTNGKYYISHDKTGRVIKVADISQAQDFHSVERVGQQKQKAPRKCSGYYWIDTDYPNAAENKDEVVQSKRNKRSKRKNFSARERIDIYRKTKGHCYLCGDFVDFDEFEIEHKIPLAKGGSNDLSNLFCSCHCCNSIKQDIYPKDFMEKISQIFMYQMGRKYRGRVDWKIISRMLKNLI